MAGGQSLVYRGQREALNELNVEEAAEKSKAETPLTDRLRGSLRCSGPRLKNCVLGFFPVLSWLPRYSFRDCALGDLISGLSVGIMHLPQGMAYALLAAVPPVFGLYSSFYPVLVYFLLGTSRHISVGSYAVMSVMIGGVTERLAPDSNFPLWSNETNGSVMVDVLSRDAERVRIAAAVTFLSGLFQILLGLVQFGFVATYLSEPLVRGYTTAVAIHVIVSQLKYTLGISPKRHSGPLSLVWTVVEVCYLLPETNIGTLVVSAVSIMTLIAMKQINTLFPKLPVRIPAELLAVIIATVATWQLSLDSKYNVEVVGKIPSGLQPPDLPAVSLFRLVVGDAFALSVVGYSIAISMGQIFAVKYGYQVDSNQELLALGFSNLVGGMFHCFAVSCSMSRSLVQESTGGKTQLAGAVSALVILVILLKAGELFQQLPKAMLAAVIFVNLHGMLRQFTDIPTLWRTNRVDMLVWVVTLISTILLNADLGLAAAVAFCLLTVIFRTQLPQYSILGQVQGTDIYKPVEEYKQVRQVPGVVIFRSSATLYFANTAMYAEALAEKSGIVVSKILSLKKKDEEAKLKRAKEAAGNGLELKGQSESEDKSQVIEEDGPPDSTLPHTIILDLSPVNFLDTAGVKCLTTIQKDYGKVGVEVLLSGCQNCVIESLERCGFFGEKVTKEQLFPSVHDAVLHRQLTVTSATRERSQTETQ
ncbi:hypothetical protein AAFF_G00344160 [Aldrovandia affinis]|uniref:STAS domain-containing protein n=1 Tax=Aldrovandia affinis TaxID=143900 RepID=A0AAD7WNY9_9TELE|nr:hypothetical protein AAFF_G00344160 [Aldrovandia affinis]